VSSPAPHETAPDVAAAADASRGDAVPSAEPSPDCDGDELDVPITVLLPPSPTPAVRTTQATARASVAAVRRRRGTHVAVLAMVACAGILGLSFSPTRSAVERAYGATENAAQHTYSEAAKALAPSWERWSPGQASPQTTPVSAPAPAEPQRTAPIVTPASPEAEAAHPAPSPPKPKLAPSKASPPTQVTLPYVGQPDLIEKRYALTPGGPKPPRDDLIDPYPDLR